MAKDFWQKQSRPIIALAPMDGYTDSAFRQVCKKVNPNLILFTEFTSADGLGYRAKKVIDKLKFVSQEKPIIAQIFGKDEKTFATAAKYCESRGFAGIDLNMGCPAKRVVKSEHGIALRKKPDIAFRLIETVVKSTSLPVSVKTRLGWSNADDLIAFGLGVQNAGADLITIHGRTYTLPYSCPADFEPIYELKRNLKIPVIGNGGITSLKNGLEKLGNLDGFMIGRAAIGNPWVFAKKPPENFKDRAPLIIKHAQYLFNDKGDKVAALQIRKHLAHYIKNIPGAANFRSRLVKVNGLKEIIKIIKEITKVIDEN